MIGHRGQNIFGPKRAQAVIELAIFGSIVIYLIGLIIAQGTSSSYQQEAELQAMRTSLLSSYQSARSGLALRNTASFMILEDRLTSGSGMYANTDRQPFMSVGSGTMSMHLFKPLDWEEVSNQSEVPVMDVRINGQLFNLKVARGMTYRVRILGGANPATARVTISMLHACATNYCNPSGACETILEDSAIAAPAAGSKDPNADAKRLLREWADYAMDGYPPAYLTVVKNDDSNFRLPSTCTPASINTEDGQRLRRFDLNRDGILPDMCCPNPLTFILWQWNWKSLTTVTSEIDMENGVYPTYDIDGDLSEETIYRLKTWSAPDCAATGYDADVMDWDRGDVNSYANPNDYSQDEQPGLKEDLRITTFQGAGTYMEVKEEKNAAQTIGRSSSTVKKNQEDKIERKYVLNDRMVLGGSLCVGGTPLQSSIQACCETVNCCGQGARGDVTCFEYPADGVKKLFIRSRIPDQRGRLWATDVTP